MLPFFLRDRGLRPKVNTIRNEMLAQPGVMKASAFHTQPGRTPVDRRILRAEGRGNATFKCPEEGLGQVGPAALRPDRFTVPEVIDRYAKLA